MLEEAGKPPAQQLRRLPISDSALVELTRRIARSGGAHQSGRNIYADYMFILALATKLLDQAPQTREDVEHMNIEEVTAESVRIIAEALHSILPGGIMEIISYLPPEKRRKGWGQGVRW